MFLLKTKNKLLLIFDFKTKYTWETFELNILLIIKKFQTFLKYKMYKKGVSRIIRMIYSTKKIEIYIYITNI